jgi:hypothetical protein
MPNKKTWEAPEITILVMLGGTVAMIAGGAVMGGENGPLVIGGGFMWLIVWYFIACYAYEQRHIAGNQAATVAAWDEIELIYKQKEIDLNAYLDSIRLDSIPDITAFSDQFTSEGEKRLKDMRTEVDRVIRRLETQLKRIYMSSPEYPDPPSKSRANKISDEMGDRAKQMGEKIIKLVIEKEAASEKAERRKEFQEFAREHEDMDLNELDRQFDEWKDKKDKI